MNISPSSYGQIGMNIFSHRLQTNSREDWLVWQPVEENNSEFKLHVKIDIVSHLPRLEGLVNTYISYKNVFQQEKNILISYWTYGNNRFKLSIGRQKPESVEENKIHDIL